MCHLHPAHTKRPHTVWRRPSFDPSTRSHASQWLVRNAVASAKKLVELCEANSIALEAAHADVVKELDEGVMCEEAGVKAIEELWGTGKLQEAYDLNVKTPTT